MPLWINAPYLKRIPAKKSEKKRQERQKEGYVAVYEEKCARKRESSTPETGDLVWECEEIVTNRTQPLHKATLSGLPPLYNQVACLEADMQGPMVAMQPQVAEVYNFCTK